MPAEEAFLRPDKHDALLQEYIGYSVIRPVAERCLGRTIIDPSKLTRLKGGTVFYLRTEFKAHINGFRYRVKGYPYTSQDTDATVCAHSALWGLCRYLSEKHMEYGEIYPYDLIEMTGKSQGRAVPYRGMTYTDYLEILSHFGTHPVFVKAKKNADDPAPQPNQIRDICTYVESGFPVLASFASHVVSLIGHTLDYDSRVTPDDKGFIDSSLYWKEFVVVDDNYFPYQLLGQSTNPHNYGKKYERPTDDRSKAYSIESIYAAVCPLPEKAFMPADEATKQAKQALSDLLGKTKNSLKSPFVTRIFLTSSTSFKRRKLEINFEEYHTIDYGSLLISALNLPHFIWVMELYAVDEYRTGKCCGEVMLDATSGKKENGVLYLRLEDQAYFKSTDKGFPVGSTRFRQYTHNLGPR